MKTENKKVCPVEKAGGLDNSLRRLLQKPHKILKPYIKDGMTVLDLGCGPGFFSIEIARIMKSSGKVIAADLQEGMLEKVRQKIKGTYLEQKVILHKCQDEEIGLAEKVDFVLAFYMVHEVPDQEKLFRELKSLLKPNGQILIVEPNFHVTKASFASMLEKAKALNFRISDGPKLFLSRTVILKNE